jgi:isochorismate hydrolase
MIISTRGKLHVNPSAYFKEYFDISAQEVDDYVAHIEQLERGEKQQQVPDCGCHKPKAIGHQRPRRKKKPNHASNRKVG